MRWCLLCSSPGTQVSAPFVQPFRRVLPSMGGLDFSVMAALFAVQIVGQLLVFMVSQLF